MPYAAHVLGEDGTLLTGLRILDQDFPAWAVEVAAAPAIIRVGLAVSEAVRVNVRLEVSFLRSPGVRLCSVHLLVTLTAHHFPEQRCNLLRCFIKAPFDPFVQKAK